MEPSEDGIVVLRKTAWTRSARATIDRARWWAEKHGDRRVAARHVLIALAETKDPRAARIAAEVAGLARLEFALANLRGSADEDGGSVSGIRDVALTPSGRALLERAVDVGSRTRGAAVQPEHLWLALASTDDVELRKLLALASSSVSALHAALRAHVPIEGDALRSTSETASGSTSRSPDAARTVELPAPAVPIEPEHREHGNLLCAPGVRRAKLEGARLSDEELLRAATIVFQHSGDDGVAEFVRTLGFDDRLRLARELKRRTDEELRAIDPFGRAAELDTQADEADGESAEPLDLARELARRAHPLAPEPAHAREPVVDADREPKSRVEAAVERHADQTVEPPVEPLAEPPGERPARRTAARSLWDRLTGTLFPERAPGER
ncbi:MAG: hypothetical protein IT453_18480 [Planctomycetes bacterium]|nr:hypothetical protein [Planctomycetota bacterium]